MLDWWLYRQPPVTLWSSQPAVMGGNVPSSGLCAGHWRTQLSGDVAVEYTMECRRWTSGYRVLETRGGYGWAGLQRRFDFGTDPGVEAQFFVLEVVKSGIRLL